MSTAEQYPGFNTRPREGHLRIVTISGTNPRAGEYLSKNLYTPNNAVLMTTDSFFDALKVRLTPAGNAGVIEILNSPDPNFQFLGVALNRAQAVVGAGSQDWGAVTLVSSPNAAQVTSIFKREGTVKGAGWFVGAGGELVFHWDHTDGSVYALRHSVEISTSRLYDVSNLPAYVDYYYKADPNGKQVEVKVVFEPLDQAGL